VATVVTAIALIISAFLYVRYKPPAPPEKIIEKHTAPYNDLIAKTTKPAPETETTIEIETLEDLAKIAEILARPILHKKRRRAHILHNR